MKNITYLLAFAVLFTTAGVANAQVRGAVDTDLQAATQLKTTTNTNNENTSSSGILEANVNADAGVRADTDTSVDSDSTREDTDSDNSVKITTKAVSNITFSIGAAAKADAETEVKNSAAVASETDLQNYAHTVVVRNEAITGVNAGVNSIEVFFNEDAKLFGFIPVTLTNKAVVTFYTAQDGTVRVETKVKKSFMRIFAQTQNTAEAVEAEVSNRLSADVYAQGQVNAHTYAQVLEDVEASVVASIAAQTQLETDSN